MSDTAELDIREQITRIDRAMAETHKFVAEQQKLAAETAKLNRDRAFVPWVVMATLLGAGAAAFAAGAAFIRLIGP